MAYFAVKANDSLELLDEYKQNIKKDTDHQLDEHQKTLNSSVEQLTVYFESKLKLLQDAEALLLISIIDENLRIPSESKSPSKTREPQFKIVRLSDRIAEFEQFVQEKEKLLQNLTKDWNDTQASIICLAVEILGTEPFEISEDDIDEELNDKIYKASRKHDADRGQHQDILTKTQDIEDKVKQLSVDTKKTVKAQQRVNHSYNFNSSLLTLLQNLKINQKKQFNKLFAGFEAMVD